MIGAMAAARRLTRWAVPALALGAVACGSGTSAPARDASPSPSRANPATPQGSSAADPVTAEEEAVIRGWSSSLRHGDVARAARYFALPSVVANGTPQLRVQTRAQAEAFNRGLPCGAEVVSLERSVHHFVVAQFRLTERPGPGSCGSGAGGSAWTAFRIQRGHIVLWQRIPDPAPPATTPS
jgi:hypothetical protein